MARFDIVLQTRASLHADGEPTRFLSEHTGFIHCTRDRDGKVFRVGKLHAYRIHANLAECHGEAVFDVCDAHSQSMHELYSALYDPKHDFLKEDVIEQFDVMESDCLVIDYVVLHPKWRGLKLGLLALRKLIDLLGGGCGLTVCEMLPLNPDAHARLKVPSGWIPRHENPEARQEAVRKLRRYFRRMGFQRIGRTPFYGLSMARRTPTSAELLKPMR
jgi:GNAT superfamily N-acetyltransferase